MKDIDKYDPYWVELGYRDQHNGLFLRRFVDENHQLRTVVEVNAEDFHRIRKENVRRVLLVQQ